jgi:hypothetical protein
MRENEVVRNYEGFIFLLDSQTNDTCTWPPIFSDHDRDHRTVSPWFISSSAHRTHRACPLHFRCSKKHGETGSTFFNHGVEHSSFRYKCLRRADEAGSACADGRCRRPWFCCGGSFDPNRQGHDIVLNRFRPGHRKYGSCFGRRGKFVFAMMKL